MMDEQCRSAKQNVLKSLMKLMDEMEVGRMKGPAKVEVEMSSIPTEESPNEAIAKIDPNKAKEISEGFKRATGSEGFKRATGMGGDQAQQSSGMPTPKEESSPEESPDMLEKLRQLYESLS